MAKASIFLLILLVFAGSGCTQFRTARKLLEFKGEEESKRAALSRETAAFERVKNVFLERRGRLPENADQARELFGEPVVINRRPNGERVWGYKPEDSNWIKGERIFIVFDREGKLISWDYDPS